MPILDKPTLDELVQDPLPPNLSAENLVRLRHVKVSVAATAWRWKRSWWKAWQLRLGRVITWQQRRREPSACRSSTSRLRLSLGVKAALASSVLSNLPAQISDGAVSIPDIIAGIAEHHVSITVKQKDAGLFSFWKQCPSMSVGSYRTWRRVTAEWRVECNFWFW